VPPTTTTVRVCPECGTRFVPTRKHQIYDDPKCRYLAFKKRQMARIEAEVLRRAGVQR